MGNRGELVEYAKRFMESDYTRERWQAVLSESQSLGAKATSLVIKNTVGFAYQVQSELRGAYFEREFRTRVSEEDWKFAIDTDAELHEGEFDISRVRLTVAAFVIKEFSDENKGE